MDLNMKLRLSKRALQEDFQGDFVKTSDEAGELIAGFATDGENHNGQVINFDGTVADYSAGSNV